MYRPDVREIPRHELYASGITGEKHTLLEHVPAGDHQLKVIKIRSDYRISESAAWSIPGGSISGYDVR